MSRRAVETFRGLAALVTLVVIVIGPPIALAQLVGWPLPRSMPSLDAISTAERSGVDDMVIVKAIACLAWVLWLQLAVAAIAEIAARATNTKARRVPTVPAAQKGIHRLVATAAVLFAGIATQRAAILPAPRLDATVAAVALTADSAASATTDSCGPSDGATAPPAELDVLPTSLLYRAEHNDSWWRIAERTLGDGTRWREVRAANVGRTMGDGAVITANTETVEPGWQLALPTDATSTQAPQRIETGATAEEDVVRPGGDHLWAMAERHLRHELGRTPTEDETRSYWRALIDANRPRLADPNRPDRVYPGQHMRLPPAEVSPGPAQLVDSPSTPASTPSAADVPPATTATEPAPLPTTALPTTTSSTTTAPPSEAISTHDSESGVDDDRLRVGVLGVAGTALAAAVRAELLRRRRRRQLRVPLGAKPSPPPAHLDDIRAEVAATADVDYPTCLHSALLEVVGAVADRRSETRPRLVQVTGNHVEVLLSTPLLPPASGWRAEASGAAWVRDAASVRKAADEAICAPLLVGLGRYTDGSDVELHLDLEAEGVVAIGGADTARADLARSWILELASAPASAGATIVVVGDEPGKWATFDRVRVVARWEDVAEDVLAYAEQTAALLEANRWPTPCVGRARAGRVDGLTPLVVFLPSPPDDADDTFATACRVVLDRSPAVTLVVAGGDVDGATRVEVGDGALRIPSLGLTCGAQAVSEEAAEQIAELLDDASREPVQLELIPRPPLPPPVSVGSRDDEYRDPPFEILVRLLGDITVVGGSRKLKPKQTAVLAYIALHAPVSAERIGDAVWVAATSSRSKRLANTVSESRSALGATHLPVAVDGRYRVGPLVVTDVDLFDRRLAYAEQQDERAAARTLRGALELVEGPVFTYRNADRTSYVWVDVENWHSDWELKVTDTAERLAQLYLDQDDLEGAMWTARRGLLASPTHPRLTKILIQGHFANGDTRAAGQVFESHQAALEALDLDEVDAELLDYYKHARQARGAAAS